MTADHPLEELLEQLLRDEWGRLLALLVTRFRRIDLAEDALGEAFEAAIRVWPTAGVPDNPQAWLLTAARRNILDRMRAEAVAARKFPLLVVDADLSDGGRTLADAGETLVDERLRLVLLCAHPTLSREAAAAPHPATGSRRTDRGRRTTVPGAAGDHVGQAYPGAQEDRRGTPDRSAR
ncbi:sigma factor [Microlunatus sp. Gsoil 973]|uniref:sigma factor n=1 Tax=Microlunatus sp. Gsoil 973 TaxID=2672569 RepID=UPI001E292FE3|nr:sigma factor [Microlunatus sp. Gsoil 973]